LLHSHLFLHDQLTFADISGTDKYPSDLQGSTTLTAKLLTRSEGTIGELKMLLAAVATDAMRNGTERITEEIIATCNYVPPSARKQRSVSG
jgi:hypothetical protein